MSRVARSRVTKSFASSIRKSQSTLDHYMVSTPFWIFYFATLIKYLKRSFGWVPTQSSTRLVVALRHTPSFKSQQKQRNLLPPLAQKQNTLFGVLFLCQGWESFLHLSARRHSLRVRHQLICSTSLWNIIPLFKSQHELSSQLVPLAHI